MEAVAENCERKRMPFGTMVLWAVCTYALYEVAVDIQHGVLEAVDSGGDPHAAEWLRRQPLLDELIFGGDPDPEDENDFRLIIERAILYGGMTIGAIALALGVTRETIYRWRGSEGTKKWRKNSGNNKFIQRGIVQALREVILRKRD